MSVSSVPMPPPPGGGVSLGELRCSAAPADDGPAFCASNAARTTAPIAATSAATIIVLLCTSLPAVIPSPFVGLHPLVLALFAPPSVSVRSIEPLARCGRRRRVRRRRVV